MANKTVNRRPESFNIRNIDEKYFNFAEFNGLCDTKNYLSVNQNTFTDVDNLYLDQDYQLSSRPPIKRVNFINPDERVLKIYKINNIVFYHTMKTDETDTYWLHFEYDKSKWTSVEVTHKINVMWFDTRYAIFKEDGIIGFDFNYDDNNNRQLRWYDGEAMVYTPIVEIVRNGVRTPHETSNSLTTSKFVRYVFDNITNIDSLTSTELIGKAMTINIGGDEFSIVWQLNIEKVFTTSIGHFDADLIQVSKSEIPVFLATRPYSDKTRMYYSTDGTLFYTIHIPTTNSFLDLANVILADDGSSAYLLRPVDDTKGKLYVWNFTTITHPSQLSSISPISYDVPVPSSYQTNLYTPYTGGEVGVKGVGYSTNWSFSLDYNTSTYEFGHSPENGKFIGMIPMTGTYTSYANNETIYSENTTIIGQSGEKKYSGSANNMFSMVILHNNVVKTYPIVADLYSRFETSPYRGTLANNVNKIRLVPSSTYPLAVLYAYSSTSSGKDTYLSATMVLNSSYVPYHYFEWTNASSNTRRIYREYFLDSNFISNVYAEGGTSHISMHPMICNNSDMQVIVKGNTRTLQQIYLSSDKEDTLINNNIALGNPSSLWTNFSDRFTYTEKSTAGKERESTPITITNDKSTQIIGSVNNDYSRYKLGDNSLLTDRYFRYGGTNISLLKRITNGQTNSIMPLVCINGRILYQDIATKNIYDNKFSGELNVDLLTKGNNTFFVPEHTSTFVSNVLSIHNKIYIASKREGKIYLPTDDVLFFSDNITALANFTQTSLGIFLENEVHELLWNSDSGVYFLSRTKLQLGCRNQSDVLLNYDGKTIFMTTLKGLTALDYQDFVQSSEHIYSYLTENIMSMYDKYSKEPLKLAQFKNWIFMYRTDVNFLYLYDLRNKSWWKWTNIDNVSQIIFDGSDLLVILDGVTYKYDFEFDGKNYYDDVGQTIEWSCTSQRLHFNAPNNYKHIRSFSIITSQTDESILRCNLWLKSYHNLQNLVDTDTVEYELDQLTTAIYKVNFFKLNAFQFSISSDKTDKDRREFVTPDIAIKYRVTERVR